MAFHPIIVINKTTHLVHWHWGRPLGLAWHSEILVLDMIDYLGYGIVLHIITPCMTAIIIIIIRKARIIFSS